MMGACCGKGDRNSNTDTGQNSNANIDVNEKIEKCKRPDDPSHEIRSPCSTQETTELCENEMVSVTKMSAIKKEPASFSDFCKPTYVRDQTECKETFKAIEAEKQ